MDAGKEILFLERRQSRTKDIPIVFTDPMGFLTLHKAIDNGVIELSNIKYFGKITRDMVHDACTCSSFYHGNSDKWRADHGYAFQCMHIIKAREERGW